MDNSPSGPCLIINNEDFDDDQLRLGSARGVQRLRNLFQQLNFEVEIKCNQTLNEFNNSLNEFISKINKNENDFDALVVIIMSHGFRNSSYDYIKFMKNNDNQTESIAVKTIPNKKSI